MQALLGEVDGGGTVIEAGPAANSLSYLLLFRVRFGKPAPRDDNYSAAIPINMAGHCRRSRCNTAPTNWGRQSLTAASSLSRPAQSVGQAAIVHPNGDSNRGRQAPIGRYR